MVKKVILKLRIMLAGEYEKAAIYSKYLGLNLGENIRITGTPSFGSEPYLITIGNNVTITHGVTFHTHDGGVSILREKHPGIDIIKPINIGNNVFIGSHVTILPGITIGNNVIVGASSVVTSDIQDNLVVAGIPARVIKTLEQYEEEVLKEAIYIKNRSNLQARKKEILTTLLKK